MGNMYTDNLIGTAIPKEFCIDVAKEWDIEYFIETGTHQGYTTVWAANNFKRVYTIENSKPIYDALNKEHDRYKNTSWLLGDSVDHLPTILNTMGNDKGIFWLDAHWTTYDYSGGKDIPHPLITELKMVLDSPVRHVIFLDDFRAMVYPNRGNDLHSWPGLKEVLRPVFECKHEYQIYIMQDSIVLVEPECEAILGRNCDNILRY